MQNEKYIGDALLQKTYTVDFLSKKRVKNNGIVPQYYVEGSHEAIIPRDLYMQVQEEMVRRANLHSGAKRKKRVYRPCYNPRHNKPENEPAFFKEMSDECMSRAIAILDEYLGKRQHEKSAEEKEKSLQDSIRKSWYW